MTLHKLESKPLRAAELAGKAQDLHRAGKPSFVVQNEVYNLLEDINSEWWPTKTEAEHAAG